MLLPWQSILVICRSYGAPAVSFPGCTIMLYQCHMPSAGPMVCQLYNTVIHSCTTMGSYYDTAGTPYGWPMVCRPNNTVIHSNAGRVYDRVYDALVVEECMRGLSSGHPIGPADGM